MEIGAFYIEGSNRIKIEVYNSTNTDTIVNLLNSNVSDSTLSILDSDDTETRENKLSKFIDRSITIEKHNFNDGHALVYFNFLDYDVSSYMVEAICGNDEVLCNVNTIEVDGDKESPYLEDHNTDNQNLQYTELEEEVFDEMPGTPILNLDFQSSSIVLDGKATVDYSGGGNRYLINDEGILVKQVERCDSINDMYSPFQLHTTKKCENTTSNLFEKFSFGLNILENKVLVQKGLYANSYKATSKNPIELIYDLNIEGTACFSILMAADKDTKAVISVNSTRKEIELTTGYNMYYVTASCIGDSRFKILCEDFTARIFVLLPQIEQNNYPTSRILPLETRYKDCLTVESEDVNIVFDPNGSDTTIGGFVDIKFVAAREFSDDNCLLDWRNDNDEGLVIYQESSNSIVASFGDDYNVRTLPVILEEGETYEVKVQWDMTTMAIKVNDEDPVIIDFGNIPMSSEYPDNIKVGWSEKYNSLNSDIVSLQIGQ